MESPIVLASLFSFFLGMIFGIYIGNRKVRHAIAGMIHTNDVDYEDED